ncbi:3-hydroxyacyl-CoA dehydrogenase family protein [Arthrobacter crystallopoietes]|uniref:3-hydroxyacyl-CoA dehydrogenase n=1 Tax=Crystallibacter crystallopoietes TaxID=37928 RepID=A0A1H1AN99_9MICC|nr:3-hydroxyacyl-CoA dehydrogenase family protein [Arthrobacter crystallopoietes]AUI53384.1 3-hydroxyacyl-CoA dehydrogenase [Arthrobacter crystallopoietes]SDQ40971.1 3-hydroxyacyl-CoA dehydrogenase [Arthrobacter crystallopoietes]
MNPSIENIKHILVIGSGAMGSQIGMVAALAGYRVTVQDIAEDMLARAKEQLTSRMQANVAKGRASQEDADAALGRLTFSTDLAAAAATADFVIEAATERLELKQHIFTQLGELTPAHAILATNSSTLGSSKVAEASGRPQQVCNMHFFNPALVMKCVEVVRNEATSQATVDTTLELARRFGKEPVLINREIPGFVANRLMGAIQKEALALHAAGIATLEDIDTTAKTALGHPMGPFELMDMVGLDVIDFIAQATYAETNDDADRPNPAITNLVARGRLGRKSGRGWYDYQS